MDIIISCIARKSGVATQCFGKAVTQKGPRCFLDVDVFARCRRAFSCLSGWLLAMPEGSWAHGSSDHFLHRRVLRVLGVYWWCGCSNMVLLFIICPGASWWICGSSHLDLFRCQKVFRDKAHNEIQLGKDEMWTWGGTTLQEFMIFHGSSNLFEAKFMVVQQQFNCVFNGTL